MKSIRKYELALLSILLLTCWLIARKFEVDIKTIYHVAQLAAEGRTSEIYLEEAGIGRFFYGPVTAAMLMPLGYFSFPVSKWIWIALQTLSFVVVFVSLYFLFPVLRGAKRWPFFLMLSFAINPVHNNFQSNNIQLMLLAVLLLSEIATRTSKTKWQVLGGIAVSLAAMVKVFPFFIVAYYAICRSNRTRLGLATGIALALALPFLFFGIGPAESLYQGFFTNLRSYEADNSLVRIPDILCLPSMLARWGLTDIGIKITSLVIGLGFLVWAKRNENPTNSLAIWSLAVLVMSLINPSTRVHYFVFYLPAFVVLLENHFQQSKRTETLFFVVTSLLLLAFTVEGVVGKNFNNWLELQSVPTFGAILLAVGIYRIVRLKPV